jgi:hypothetical protein
MQMTSAAASCSAARLGYRENCGGHHEVEGDGDHAL